MRFALIGDVHGNLYALNAVIKDCVDKDIDHFVFLGDYIMDGPYCNEVLDKVRNISKYAIAGNKEYFIQNYSNKTKDYDQLAGAHWTYNTLTDNNIKYISSLKDRIDIEHNGKKIVFSHFPLYHYKHENGIFDLIDVEKIFERSNFDVIVSAHTHRPLEAIMYNRRIICPGSCGLPLAGNNNACYGVLDIDDDIKYNFYTVNYDIKEYISSFSNFVGFEDCRIWTKYYILSIQTGKNYSVDFLLYAKALMKQYGRSSTGLVDNDIWELADKKYSQEKNL